MVRLWKDSLVSSFSSLPAPKKSGHKEDSHTLASFFYNIYLPHMKLYKRSWSTDERLARDYLSPFFGHKRFCDIQKSDVEAWLHALLAKGLSPATCNRILAVFRTVCSLAIARDVLPAALSPCAGVRPLKITTKRERALTWEEARRLIRELEKSPRPEAFVLRLLLLTGARKSEILNARWEDVHLEQRILIVPLSKSGKPRIIYLSKEAIAVLRALPRTPGNPWLFPGHAQGKPLSDIYLFWNALRQRLGLKNVRVHDLRHTFASFLVNAGYSLYEVQMLLGHCDPRSTMRYAHLGQDALLAAAQMVGSFLTLRKKTRSWTRIVYVQIPRGRARKTRANFLRME